MIALWEHTGMIFNRGFTPCELRLKGQRVDDVEPDVSAVSNIIDFQTARKNKFFPNNPCPYGPPVFEMSLHHYYRTGHCIWQPVLLKE